MFLYFVFLVLWGCLVKHCCPNVCISMTFTAGYCPGRLVRWLRQWKRPWRWRGVQEGIQERIWAISGCYFEGRGNGVDNGTPDFKFRISVRRLRGGPLVPVWGSKLSAERLHRRPQFQNLFPPKKRSLCRKSLHLDLNLRQKSHRVRHVIALGPTVEASPPWKCGFRSYGRGVPHQEIAALEPRAIPSTAASEATTFVTGRVVPEVPDPLGSCLSFFLFPGL